MIKKLLLYLIGFAILISGCGEGRSLPHSAGRRDDIILITREAINIQPVLDKLQQARFYPTREEIYNVRIYSPDALEQYKFWRNLIVIGTVEDSYIKRLRGEESEKEAGIYTEEDLWVKLQSVVVIAGESIEGTEMLCSSYADTIYKIFRSRERERFEKVLYIDGYEEDKTEKMENVLGASFRIPFGYAVSREGDNFMTYIRKNPDRLVTLLYSNDEIVNPIKFRNMLFEKNFDGDSVLMEYRISEDSVMKMTYIDTVDFKGHKAVKIKGIWQNRAPDKIMGGPFISYIFEKDGIWYFLDGHVFAPGKKKWVYLEEVDLIMHTFEKGF